MILSKILTMVSVEKKTVQPLAPGTIKNYEYLRKHLHGFIEKKGFNLKLYIDPHTSLFAKTKGKTVLATFLYQIHNVFIQPGLF